MRELFGVKRKLHYLINYLFYFIVFILGYFAGGGSFEKVTNVFNNII